MPREPLLMCAIGKKGVGKTYAHMLLMNGYVMGDPYVGVKGRKCLIMDLMMNILFLEFLLFH